MALKDIVIKSVPTSYTVTGGTALPLSVKKADGSSQTLTVTGDTDFRIQRSLKIDVVDPKPNAGAPNGYTLQRFSSYFKWPKILANGKIQTQTVTTVAAVDVETTVAERTLIADWQAQMWMDPNFRSAFINGAIG